MRDCWCIPLWLALWTSVLGCSGKATKETPPSWSSAIKPALSEIPSANLGHADFQFEDITTSSNLQFTHVSGNSPEKYFPAANGSGVGLLDVDNNGLLDLYFLTARPLPFTPGSPGPTNRLFLQQPGTTFTEVGVPAGLALSGFFHGVCRADLNNDGFDDLVLTAYGGTRLLLGSGDGTFYPAHGFSDNRWGSSAATGDFDNDGDTDLYVTHYGLWSIEQNLFCGDQRTNIRTFCNPNRITPVAHAYYRNDGNGHFTDTTLVAGLARTDGRGQGVVACDLNGDGHLDLYVANDLCPNFLYLGKGDGTFKDVTDYCGAAFSREGAAQAGMGVDAGDIDRDGKPELFVTNFRGEYNALYQNLGDGLFMDKSHTYGVAGDSVDEVGWGTRLVDFDNDGWLDIFVSNGHVDDNISQVIPGVTYAQTPKIWRNARGRFKLQKPSAGAYFSSGHVGRGAAFGDIDNDHQCDIAINHVDAPAVLLRNISPGAGKSKGRALRIELVGRRSNRDAVGTTIVVENVGTPERIVCWCNSGASYLSSHDHRVLIGVGETEQVKALRVRWPSGKEIEWRDLSTRHDFLLVEPIDGL